MARRLLFLTHTPEDKTLHAVRRHPCRCLCRGFPHRMRTTPRLRTTLHFAQIGLTDDLTFMTIHVSQLLKTIGNTASG